MSQSQVLYGLEDRPGFAISLTAAIQHVLASFIGVVTPTLESLLIGVLGTAQSAEGNASSCTYAANLTVGL